MKKIQKSILISLAILFLYLLNFCPLAEAQETPQVKVEYPAPKKVTIIGNVTVLGSYSKVCGGNNLSGLYASGNFAPVVRLSERDYLIPLYSGLYKRQRQIINEEEGGRLYTTIMNHNFSLMHKHIYPALLTQRITGFASLNYNKETSDESFGDGLYDYRDYGASVDYQYNLIKTETDKGTLLFGGKYYFRRYPNFHSLISLSAQAAPEEDEKDQNVFGANSRYTHRFTDKLILSLSYDFLFKRFSDKYTVDENGILEDKKRKDRVHFFKLDGDYRLSKRFILGLDTEIELNNSNQNYYDTMNTPLALGDDIFVPHYFNYNRYEIKPSLTYLFPLKENKNIAFKLAYAYTLRDYPNRNIKNAQNVYQSETQEDRIHAAYLNISYPITKELSFLINADYMHIISNMEYERFYRYDYDLYHLLCGLSYKF
ncbi:MAG: hypothetical protein ISS43_04775 [Candidatus Omnitrophica bacterium]|nr:hypothetical protein [Candidatus Omnitrophota bacterium]